MGRKGKMSTLSMNGERRKTKWECNLDYEFRKAYNQIKVELSFQQEVRLKEDKNIKSVSIDESLVHDNCKKDKNGVESSGSILPFSAYEPQKLIIRPSFSKNISSHFHPYLADPSLKSISLRSIVTNLKYYDKEYLVSLLSQFPLEIKSEFMVLSCYHGVDISDYIPILADPELTNLYLGQYFNDHTMATISKHGSSSLLVNTCGILQDSWEDFDVDNIQLIQVNIFHNLECLKLFNCILSLDGGLYYMNKTFPNVTHILLHNVVLKNINFCDRDSLGYQILCNFTKKFCHLQKLEIIACDWLTKNALLKWAYEFGKYRRSCDLKVLILGEIKDSPSFYDELFEALWKFNIQIIII